MGINIMVRKIKKLENGYVKDIGDFSKWDSVRQSFDREFNAALGQDIDCIYEEDGPSGYGYIASIYFRPKKIKEAREWVKRNVSWGQRKRYYDILKEMGKDKSLYFKISY